MHLTRVQFFFEISDIFLQKNTKEKLDELKDCQKIQLIDKTKIVL